ncbi:MAG: hypothetical protein EOO28_08050 [Comamonadaceae bacterium]|nr:MAG: hypothetical protein EOO28_08050 [Comamonadaceae bacterium]
MACRPRQAGLAALVLVCVLLALVTAWVSLDAARSWSGRTVGDLMDERDALRQARQEITFFASSTGRLPQDVPDGSGGGSKTVAYLPDPELTGSGSRHAIELCTALKQRSGMAYSLVAKNQRGAGATHAVSREALFDTFECDAVLASIESLALTANLAAEAVGLQDANVKKAADLENVLQVMLVHRSLEVSLAGFDLAAGIYTLVDNEVKLQAAMAASIAGFPLPANAIPGFIAGIASANTALALNALDIPRSVVSLAVDAATLQRYQDVAAEALDSSIWKGGDGIVRQAHSAGTHFRMDNPSPADAL